MSAFLCSAKHIAALAAYAVSRDCAISQWKSYNKLETVRRLAQELAKENIRSIEARYPTKSTEPVNNLGDALAIKESADMAERYFFNPPRLTPVQILKLCRCFNYQACETDDWQETLAFRQLDWIQSGAISELPNYDDAPWEYNGEFDTAS